MKILWTTIASGFGAGFLRPGPGTWGTLVGCILLYLLSLTRWNHSIWVFVIFLVLTLLGYLAIRGLPEDWKHDDQRIVIDEIVGVMAAVLWLPLTLTNLLLAFVLFRFFDIFKPLGIRKFDQLKNDWSVLVDDIVAGVYANLAIRIILIFLPWI